MKLKTVSLLCVGSVLLCGILACSNQAKQSTEENNDEQQLFIGDNIAVAQTQYGKVKGFILKGIYNFRGVPYGASTAGENRFMPPREPEPWEGIRPAVFWGDTAPQKTKGTDGHHGLSQKQRSAPGKLLGPVENSDAGHAH